MALEDANPADEPSADELLRRALLDADDSAAVALKINGLPLSEALTVIFHGRRDLGSIQTYVTHGRRGAGAAVSASELLRVPCDLDLSEAEDRDEAERLYAEQAGGADVVLRPRPASCCACPAPSTSARRRTARKRSGSTPSRRPRSATRSS